MSRSQQVNALNQVAETSQDPVIQRNAEMSRFICVGFEIPIDEAHCGHTVLPPFQIIPLRMRQFRVRGTGQEGVAVTRGNITGMVESGEPLTSYPGIVFDGIESRYGNPHSPNNDWGLTEFKVLRGCDKWDTKQFINAGLLTDEEIEHESLRDYPRPSWVVAIDKLNDLLFPASVEIFSMDSSKQKDMCGRLRKHLESIEFAYGELVGKCVNNALDMVAGYLRYIENHIRMLASEVLDGGRQGVIGTEVIWRRHANLELPGNLSLGGLLPSDPEYRNQKGVFSDDEKQMIMGLLGKKANEPAISFDEAVQQATEAKLAELLKSGKIKATNDDFSL